MWTQDKTEPLVLQENLKMNPSFCALLCWLVLPLKGKGLLSFPSKALKSILLIKSVKLTFYVIAQQLGLNRKDIKNATGKHILRVIFYTYIRGLAKSIRNECRVLVKGF